MIMLDYLGVFVFAVSGALLAYRKHMDIFGFVVMALAPAIGGGTLRDLMLDVPVFWIYEPSYLFVTLAAALLTFAAHRFFTRAQRILVWFDAVGLSVFCVLGAAKAFEATNNATVAVVMGVITAVAGGIIRDVIANDVPLILQKEIYATAAFFGALIYVLLEYFQFMGAQWYGISAALLLRTLGVVKQLSLPRP